jgi:Rieske Fe-S protein
MEKSHHGDGRGEGLPGRRKFLISSGLGVLYGLAAAFLAWPVLSFITFREATRKVIVFRPKDRKSAVSFKGGVFLVTRGEEPMAFSARCTHLGCTLSFDEVSKRFQCPCHGSVFDMNGKRVAGPAKRDLERIPITKGKKGDLHVILTL